MTMRTLTAADVDNTTPDEWAALATQWRPKDKIAAEFCTRMHHISKAVYVFVCGQWRLREGIMK